MILDSKAQLLSHPTNRVDRLAIRLVRVWTRRQGAGLFARIARVALNVLGIDWCPVYVGTNLRMPHAAAGSVVHRTTVIGNDVTIFHQVTVGRVAPDGAADLTPGDEGVVIEDGVVVGAGAAILFRPGQTLTIGCGATIGANSVVLSSVGPGETWAGVPARPIGPA